MDVGKPFTLDSVRVTLDDKDVAAYLYTPLEVQALHRGGVQRLYVGNLRAGSHELVAFFNGNGPQDRDYTRSAAVRRVGARAGVWHEEPDGLVELDRLV